MKIVTSLHFHGQCREAMTFYAETLGGKIRAMMTFGEAPADIGIEAAYSDWVIHAWIDVGDHSIMGADLPPQFAPDNAKPMHGFDVSFNSYAINETRRVFDGLSQGAQIRMPFGPTFWSRGFGALTDRFGVPWSINTLAEMT